MPYGNPIIHGDSVRSVAAQREADKSGKRYQAATANTARGRNRAEANTPRLKRICHSPGSIQTVFGSDPDEHRRDEHPGDTDGTSCSTA